MKTVSFDIFDTLITRRTATPTGIFSIMENELKNNNLYKDYNNYIKNNWYIIRETAEQYARDSSLQEEITINDIYIVIKRNFSLTDQQIDQLKELEILTEYNNSIPIEENINKVLDYISKGYNILLISDMYLDKVTIRKLLLKHNSIFRDIKIFVSSEYLKTKSSFSMFKHIKDLLGIQYSQWEHIGDNVYSDVEVPRKLGILVNKYNYVELEQYEKNLLKEQAQDLYTQLQIGVAKNTRLLYKLNKYASLGSGIAGNIIFTYAVWIVENALSQNLNRLYFVARDGYIIKNVVDIIIKHKHLHIKTYYIYGSRLVWRPLALPDDGDLSKIDWCFNIYETKTLLDFCVYLSLDEKQEFISMLPLKYRNLEKKISVRDIEYLKKYIYNTPNINSFLKKHIKKTKENILNYIKQEVDFSDNLFAFVDLRGTGLTLSILSEALKKSLQIEEVKIFLMEKDVLSSNLLTMLSEYKSAKFYVMYNMNKFNQHDIIEVLTRAPHGQTLYYIKDINTGEMKAVLEEKEGIAINNYFFKDYIYGIRIYTINLLITTDKIKIDLYPNLDVFYKYYNFLIYYPDKKTADIIGDIPFTINSINNNLVKYAPVYKSFGKFRTSWLVGSYARKDNRYYKNQIKHQKKNRRILHIYYSKRKRIAYIEFFGKRFYLQNG